MSAEIVQLPEAGARAAIVNACRNGGTRAARVTPIEEELLLAFRSWPPDAQQAWRVRNPAAPPAPTATAPSWTVASLDAQRRAKVATIVRQHHPGPETDVRTIPGVTRRGVARFEAAGLIRLVDLAGLTCLEASRRVLWVRLESWDQVELWMEAAGLSWAQELRQHGRV